MSELLDGLRQRLKDTQYESAQFEFVVSGAGSAIVDISTEGHFATTVSGGPSVDVDLSLTTYNTIRKLVNYLNTQSGYLATFVADGDPDHESLDIQVMVPVDCTMTVVFRTRRWADDELTRALELAVSRHNLSLPADSSLGYAGGYTVDTVPSDHYYFVYLLAHIEILKTMVAAGVNARGVDFSVENFNTLKASLEDEYAKGIVLFLARTKTLSEEDTKDLGSGDIIVGHSFRETLRRPAQRRDVPLAISPKPVAETLTASALGSGKVLLQWTRNRDVTFCRYEVWSKLGTGVSNLSDIVRPAGAIPATGVKTRVEYEQDKTIWVDGATTALTPGAYTYILYVYNRNEEFTGSVVVPVTVT